MDEPEAFQQGPGTDIDYLKDETKPFGEVTTRGGNDPNGKPEKIYFK